MRKILLLLALTFSILLSSELGTVYGLDPNGDGFLSLRKKPKSTQIGKLYNGDKVKILDRRGKWYKVKEVRSGKIGWSHSNWIGVSTSRNNSSSKRYRVFKIRSNDTLSVRSNAGVHNRKIGDLAYNATGIKKIKCKNSPKGERWCKVSHSSIITGWVSAKYISSKKRSTSSSKQSYSSSKSYNSSSEKSRNSNAELGAAIAVGVIAWGLGKMISGDDSSSSSSSSSVSHANYLPCYSGDKCFKILRKISNYKYEIECTKGSQTGRKYKICGKDYGKKWASGCGMGDAFAYHYNSIRQAGNKACNW